MSWALTSGAPPEGCLIPVEALWGIIDPQAYVARIGPLIKPLTQNIKKKKQKDSSFHCRRWLEHHTRVWPLLAEMSSFHSKKQICHISFLNNIFCALLLQKKRKIQMFLHHWDASKSAAVSVVLRLGSPSSSSCSFLPFFLSTFGCAAVPRLRSRSLAAASVTVYHRISLLYWRKKVLRVQSCKGKCIFQTP